MSTTIDGKKIAADIRTHIATLRKLKPAHVAFDIVYVGSDPVIDTFIKYKKSFGQAVGVDVRIHNFDADILESELIDHVLHIAQNSHAIIVQLPLPQHISAQKVLDQIPPEKDVDVLGRRIKEQFKSNQTLFYPAVTGAIIKCIDYYAIPLGQQKIVVIGNGNLVGQPVQSWLDRQGFEYHVVIKETHPERKKDLLKTADIIISGAGQPHMIQPDDIKDGVVLIDAGTSESDRRVLGDIHPDCFEKSAYMTPVPGGIGPITIAILYENIMRAHGYDI